MNNKTICILISITLIISGTVRAFADSSGWFCPVCGIPLSGEYNYCWKDGTAKPDESSSGVQIFAYGMTIEEFEPKADLLYRQALSWTDGFAPEKFDALPVVPKNLFTVFKQIQAIPFSLSRNGSTCTWNSGAAGIFAGNYGVMTRNMVYGWGNDGNDVYFSLTGSNEYQAALAGTSEINYVRHDAVWQLNHWECNVCLDYPDAANSASECSVMLVMFNPDNGFALWWIIDPDRNEVTVRVYLNNDDKYFTMNYDLATHRLISCGRE